MQQQAKQAKEATPPPSSANVDEHYSVVSPLGEDRVVGALVAPASPASPRRLQPRPVVSSDPDRGEKKRKGKGSSSSDENNTNSKKKTRRRGGSSVVSSSSFSRAEEGPTTWTERECDDPDRNPVHAQVVAVVLDDGGRWPKWVELPKLLPPVREVKTDSLISPRPSLTTTSHDSDPSSRPSSKVMVGGQTFCKLVKCGLIAVQSRFLRSRLPASVCHPSHGGELVVPNFGPDGRILTPVQGLNCSDLDSWAKEHGLTLLEEDDMQFASRLRTCLFEGYDRRSQLLLADAQAEFARVQETLRSPVPSVRGICPKTQKWISRPHPNPHAVRKSRLDSARRLFSLVLRLRLIRLATRDEVGGNGVNAPLIRLLRAHVDTWVTHMALFRASLLSSIETSIVQHPTRKISEPRILGALDEAQGRFDFALLVRCRGGSSVSSLIRSSFPSFSPGDRLVAELVASAFGLIGGWDGHHHHHHRTFSTTLPTLIDCLALPADPRALAALACEPPFPSVSDVVLSRASPSPSPSPPLVRLAAAADRADGGAAAAAAAAASLPTVPGVMFCLRFLLMSAVVGDDDGACGGGGGPFPNWESEEGGDDDAAERIRCAVRGLLARPPRPWGGRWQFASATTAAGTSSFSRLDWVDFDPSAAAVVDLGFALGAMSTNFRLKAAGPDGAESPASFTVHFRASTDPGRRLGGFGPLAAPFERRLPLRLGTAECGTHAVSRQHHHRGVSSPCFFSLQTCAVLRGSSGHLVRCLPFWGWRARPQSRDLEVVPVDVDPAAAPASTVTVPAPIDLALEASLFPAADAFDRAPPPPSVAPPLPGSDALLHPFLRNMPVFGPLMAPRVRWVSSDDPGCARFVELFETTSGVGSGSSTTSPPPSAAGRFVRTCSFELVGAHVIDNPLLRSRWEAYRHELEFRERATAGGGLHLSSSSPAAAPAAHGAEPEEEEETATGASRVCVRTLFHGTRSAFASAASPNRSSPAGIADADYFIASSGFRVDISSASAVSGKGSYFAYDSGLVAQHYGSLAAPLDDSSQSPTLVRVWVVDVALWRGQTGKNQQAMPDLIPGTPFPFDHYLGTLKTSGGGVSASSPPPPFDMRTVALPPESVAGALPVALCLLRATSPSPAE